MGILLLDYLLDETESINIGEFSRDDENSLVSKTRSMRASVRRDKLKMPRKPGVL